MAGVDYECLDQNTIDTVTRRFEVALKLLDEKFRLYQYLSKRNQEQVPHQLYKNEVVNQAIRSRAAHFHSRAESLFSIRIHFVILYEGFRHKVSFLESLQRLVVQPRQALEEIFSLFRMKSQVTLIESQLNQALSTLHHKVHGLVDQLSDVCPLSVLDKDQAFVFLRSLVNFTPHKVDGSKRKYDTFLDYYVSDSTLECHRDHLRLDDYTVKVLTLKEPSSQSFPLIFKSLLEVEANFIICTEWKTEEGRRIQKNIQSKRRHYHNSKTSLLSHLGSPDPSKPSDLLIDDSKESLVRELGEGKKELEIHGNYFGEFSLTVVLYDQDQAKINKSIADFYKIFSTHDAVLCEERYNLFNAFLATVPGNYQLNLRRMYILNTNYADYSFLFAVHQGERKNSHLDKEYLAVLETNQKTPYYLNLHHQDLAHTVILGKSGSGKSFLLNFLIAHLQKYEPYTFIFDLGGAYRSITGLFGGSFLQVGVESQSFRINPFCLTETRENLNFLLSFISLLIEEGGKHSLTHKEERDLYEQIEMLYSIEPSLRTLSTLSNTLNDPLKGALHKWTQEGPYGFLFDNPEDTLTFSRFQCIEFEGMDKYPQLIEPLLFYLLHRANDTIQDDAFLGVFKPFIIDEAWIFFRNPTVRSYIIEALKTWRKKNAAMILATQSLDELKKSDILDLNHPVHVPCLLYSIFFLPICRYPRSRILGTM